jgi:hypothetical protein
MLNKTAAQLALGVFQRRMASSTFALLRSLERRLARLEGSIDWADLLAAAVVAKITAEQLGGNEFYEISEGQAFLKANWKAVLGSPLVIIVFAVLAFGFFFWRLEKGDEREI